VLYKYLIIYIQYNKPSSDGQKELEEFGEDGVRHLWALSPRYLMMMMMMMMTVIYCVWKNYVLLFCVALHTFVIPSTVHTYK